MVRHMHGMRTVYHGIPWEPFLDHSGWLPTLAAPLKCWFWVILAKASKYALKTRKMVRHMHSITWDPMGTHPGPSWVVADS